MKDDVVCLTNLLVSDECNVNSADETRFSAPMYVVQMIPADFFKAIIEAKVNANA